MKDRFYHPELDRLRFFAFFAVFIHHFFPHHPSSYKELGSVAATILASCANAGSLGVDLFFCLSSFLITTLLVREYDSRGTIDIRAFWIRRILRIWPLYYFFIAFAAIIVPFFLDQDRLGGVYLLGFIFLGGNWVCAVKGYPESVAGPLWCVSIEEQFYLAWPLLLSIVSFRRLTHLACGCLFIATVTRVFAVYEQLPHPGIWCNTFARLDPIALGAIFAVFSHNRRYSISSAVRFLLLAPGVIVPPALIVLLGDSCISGAASVFFYPIVAICCVFILAAFYSGVDQDVGRGSGMSAALVYLGRISYGLYVFHLLAIRLWDSLFLNDWGHSLLYKAAFLLVRFLVAFGLTLGFAAASYSLLEKPFLRLKERFTYVDSVPVVRDKNR